MSTLPRPGYLNIAGNIILLANLNQCFHIIPPSLLIKIYSQKLACIIFEQGIDANNDLTTQVSVDMFIIKRD